MAIIHNFGCEKCGRIEQDVVCSSANHDNDPKCCGETMYRHFGNIPISVHEFVPFTTRNIHPDGKPLLVRNKGDLQRYYRQYGVVHYDDPNLVAQGDKIVRKDKAIGRVFDFGRK